MFQLIQVKVTKHIVKFWQIYEGSILLYAEEGTRFCPNDIRERYYYGESFIFIWAGIMINGQIELQIFYVGNLTRDGYCQEVFLSLCVCSEMLLVQTFFLTSWTTRLTIKFRACIRTCRGQLVTSNLSESPQKVNLEDTQPDPHHQLIDGSKDFQIDRFNFGL